MKDMKYRDQVESAASSFRNAIERIDAGHIYLPFIINCD